MANILNENAVFLQNLKDAGFGGKLISKALEYKCANTAESSQQLMLLLKSHRQKLLKKSHDTHCKIDCPDHLLFQLKKNI